MKGADTNCMVHRREIVEVVGGWDEQCRWDEDWYLFLRVHPAFPDKIRWVPHILVEYRQVFGEGADGVCAEAHENVEEEIKLRQYLLQKWKHHPDFAAFKSLEKKAEDLLLMRAGVRIRRPTTVCARQRMARPSSARFGAICVVCAAADWRRHTSREHG